jgi:hypothetical protein
MNINEPWEASVDWAPDFPRGSHVFDGFGKEIAGPISMDEATLIAAAPDLYNTLLYAKIAVRQLCEGQDPDRQCWVTYRAICGAIMKAQGTNP